MKIEDSAKPPVGLPAGPISTKSARNPEKTSAVPVKVENVQLNTPHQISEASIDTNPYFDTVKVASIKAAISSGTFKVDIEKVADSLIKSTAQVLYNKKDNK